MKIGVLGTGMVGATIATKLVELGHEVMMGSRTADNEQASEWDAAGEENLSGKVLVDLANPLDFSQGMPPTLTICNDDSLGEQIQRALPDAKVVKALNTVNAQVMVEPDGVPGDHDIFMCGNDESAKGQVSELPAGFWLACRSHRRSR